MLGLVAAILKQQQSIAFRDSPEVSIQWLIESLKNLDHWEYDEAQKQIFIRAINAARLLSKHKHRHVDWCVRYIRQCSLPVPDVELSEGDIDILATSIVNLGLEATIEIAPVSTDARSIFPSQLEEAELIAKALESGI